MSGSITCPSGTFHVFVGNVINNDERRDHSIILSHHTHQEKQNVLHEFFGPTQWSCMREAKMAENADNRTS